MRLLTWLFGWLLDDGYPSMICDPTGCYYDPNIEERYP